MMIIMTSENHNRLTDFPIRIQCEVFNTIVMLKSMSMFLYSSGVRNYWYAEQLIGRHGLIGSLATFHTYKKDVLINKNYQKESIFMHLRKQ